MANGLRKRTVIGITVLLLTAACSVQEHYRTLSFFFDGVPSPKSIRQAAVADSLQAATPAADSSAIFAQAITPTSFVHQPYLDKKCDNCHNSGNMSSTKQLMPELCYQCHTDFATLYTFEHGPSAAGYCTQCHHPHQSKEEKLLVRSGSGLCLQCHDTLLIAENQFHNLSAETNCTTCHNPHGSNNHSLMQSDACYKCHENFNDKYKVVHGPVVVGHCASCHTPHRNGTEKLLSRSGRDLCLHCHNAELIMANENHKDTEEASCTDCHNPHGGSDKFMLN